MRINERKIAKLRLDTSQLKNIYVPLKHNRLTFYDFFGIEHSSTFFDVGDIEADDSRISNSNTMFRIIMNIADTEQVHTDLSILFDLKYDFLV